MAKLPGAPSILSNRFGGLNRMCSASASANSPLAAVVSSLEMSSLASLAGALNGISRYFCSTTPSSSLASSSGSWSITSDEGKIGSGSSDSGVIIKRHSSSRVSSDRVKPHVAVVGTGWSSYSFFRNLDHRKYDVSIISPRNYFAFTPLLPSVAGGTISPLSCIEPVRTYTNREGRKTFDFYEAYVTHVDFKDKLLACKCGAVDRSFKLPYDYLVLAFGTQTTTFGVPGVEKYAYFLKEVEHAIVIRKKVMSNFEKAALPMISEAEKKRLLHFVVVGGGPTGVESVGEFRDLIKEDMSKYFPELMPYVSLSLIEAGDRLLPMFSQDVSNYSMDIFKNRMHVNLLLQHQVTEVGPTTLRVKSRSEEVKEMEYGFVLWASGVGQVALSKSVIESVPDQKGARVMRVDHKFRLIGADNAYALGDCCHLEPPRLVDHAADIYQRANGQAPSTKWLIEEAKYLQKVFPQLSPLKWDPKNQPERASMNLDEFREYLGMENEKITSRAGR